MLTILLRPLAVDKVKLFVQKTTDQIQRRLEMILKATYTLRLDLPIDEGTSKPGPVSKVRISP